MFGKVNNYNSYNINNNLKKPTLSSQTTDTSIRLKNDEAHFEDDMFAYILRKLNAGLPLFENEIIYLKANDEALYEIYVEVMKERLELERLEKENNFELIYREKKEEYTNEFNDYNQSFISYKLKMLDNVWIDYLKKEKMKQNKRLDVHI